MVIRNDWLIYFFLLVSGFSLVTWNLYGAMGCKVVVKATRPSAGCFIAYKFTCCLLNSNLCSGIWDILINITMVSGPI